MSSDLGLSDYAFYLGPAGGTGGLTFGIGTNVDVISVVGLTDLQARFEDRPLARRHGALPTMHLASSRVMEFEIIARKGTLTDAQWRDLIDSVEAAFGPVYGDVADKELHFKFPGDTERFIRVKPTRRSTVRSWRSETGLYGLRCELRADDPTWFVAAKQISLNQTGTFNVTNLGNADAFPKLTFSRSAATRVRVTNNTTGEVVDVMNLPSASTDVVADMDIYNRGLPGLVIYVGTTNHYGNWQLVRKPLHLHPGVNSLTLNNGTAVDVEWWHPFL